MKPDIRRRSFLSSLAFAIPTARAADDSAGDYEQEYIEWPTESLLRGTFHEDVETARDPEEKQPPPELLLTVELEEFDREKIEFSDNAPPRYLGRELPAECGNHPTLLRKFDLLWGKVRFTVPENLWKDLGGLRIERMKTPRPPMGDKRILSWQQSDENLFRPRLWKSADGGTALIEWVRAEE